MEVDLQAVCRVFEDLLNGSMLREQADRWAYAVVVQEEETGIVTYLPPFERERIWAGVIYLYGINTMRSSAGVTTSWLATILRASERPSQRLAVNRTSVLNWLV